MKAVRVILIFALLAWGGYYASGRDNSFFASFPSSGGNRFFAAVKKIGDAAAQKASGIISGAKDVASSAVAFVESKVAETADTAKDKAAESIASAVKTKVNDAARSIGLGGTAGSQPVRVAVKAGTPAHFTIENESSKETATYSVDWRDGAKDAGTIKASASATVSHSWANAGEYDIHFKIEGGKGEQAYQVIVSIFK